MAHKPLYIKNLCQVGKNTIQIAVTACCCVSRIQFGIGSSWFLLHFLSAWQSHRFVLQLVHRRRSMQFYRVSWRSVFLESILALIKVSTKHPCPPSFACVIYWFIVRSIFAVPNRTGGQDGVEQTSIKVSLKCPISFRRILLPARGRECRHVQVIINESSSVFSWIVLLVAVFWPDVILAIELWRRDLEMPCLLVWWTVISCSIPVVVFTDCCLLRKPIPLDFIEVDQFIWGILTTVARRLLISCSNEMLKPCNDCLFWQFESTWSRRGRDGSKLPVEASHGTRHQAKTAG